MGLARLSGMALNPDRVVGWREFHIINIMWPIV